MITAVSAAEAMKLIVGRGELNTGLIHMDVWTHEYELFGGGAPRPECPTCVLHSYDFLNATVGTTSSSLCGRNAVQVSVHGSHALDLTRLAGRLQSVAARVECNEYLLKATIDGHEFTVFPDNRAIIKGIDDEELAKGLYARYIGG
jgi:adenylyltransferase/sulfurtransferase